MARLIGLAALASVIAALTIRSFVAAPSATVKERVGVTSARTFIRPEISELLAEAKVVTAVLPHSHQLPAVVEETPLLIRSWPAVRFTPPVMFQMCWDPIKVESTSELSTFKVVTRPVSQPKAAEPPVNLTTEFELAERVPRITPVPLNTVSCNTRVPAFTVVPPV